VLANSTVIIPVPGVVLTSTFAAVFPPIGVAIAAGLGAALGELSGYLAGYSGRLVVENRAHYDQFVEWMRRYGDWTILVLAFLPNPAFDLAGIMAGGLKLPVPRFLVFCAAGKIMKMLVFAYAGGSILRWISMLFQR
jgi:membrane protein DedA with SNARE-associated domain